MSMTREEVNKRLKGLRMRCQRLLVSSRRNPEEWRKDIAALDLALTALRPVSREQVEKMRSRWVPLNNTQEHFCESCGVTFNLYAYCRNDYQFCPSCGAPMTDEAVDMVMDRMEELHESP